MGLIVSRVKDSLGVLIQGPDYFASLDTVTAPKPSGAPLTVVLLDSDRDIVRPSVKRAQLRYC